MFHVFSLHPDKIDALSAKLISSIFSSEATEFSRQRRGSIRHCWFFLQEWNEYAGRTQICALTCLLAPLTPPSGYTSVPFFPLYLFFFVFALSGRPEPLTASSASSGGPSYCFLGNSWFCFSPQTRHTPSVTSSDQHD